MKKNLFKKGVAMLGTISLLANTTLPGLQVYADSEGLSAPAIEKIDIEGWQEGDAEGIKTNNSKYEISYVGDTLTITDNGLTSYEGGAGNHKYVGLLVDFGTAVKGKTNYNIEDVDKTDADRWGGSTESDTDFVMWLSEAKNGLTLTFEDEADSTKTRNINVVFKEIDAENVSFDKLTIPTEATDTYIEKITANNGKFELNYNSGTNELSVIDNGLVKYNNGHGENEWIGILADFGAEVEGMGTAGAYGVEDVDRTEAHRWGANGTEFVMWLSDARNGQDITLKSKKYNNDTYTFKLVFKETVKFESNGGSAVEDQVVTYGEQATEPTVTKEGFTLVGWYSDEGLTTPYNFSSSVNENITLYAKWAPAMVIDKNSIKKAITTDENREHTNQDKYDLDWDSESKVVTITDKGLENVSTPTNNKWLGLIIDFGVPTTTATSSDSTTYTIEEGNGDRTDADIYGGNTDSNTDFILWISELKDGKKIKFVNQEASNDAVEVKFVFKTLNKSVVNFKKLTIPTEATDAYIKEITANNGKFELNYDSGANELSVIDNGLVKYNNGHGENKWIGILADFGAVVEGVAGGYGVEDVDRTDAARWGANGTEFIMWLSDARNNQDITLKKSTSTYNDDSITFKLLFKETVKFDSKGGSNVANQTVVMGETAAEPSAPTRNGYTFKGWYSDEELTTAYDFSTAVNENITLYAKWEQNKSSGGSSSGGGGSSKSTTKTTETKANTGDTAKVDNAKTDNKVTDNNTNDNTKTPAYNDKYSQEFNDAYQFAYKNGITTMPSIEEADMEGTLTRIAMAKMLSQYAINVLGKTPDTTKVVPAFPDVTAQMDADYNNGVTLAYQLGIMGIGIDKFRPDDLVTRAEFATALSRLLFNTPDGEGAYYETHLAKLMEEKIITNNNPDLQELRGYVMIMLMRSAQS